MSSIAETVDKIRTLAESYDDLADAVGADASGKTLQTKADEIKSTLSTGVATKAQGNEIITTLGGHTSKLTDFAQELDKIGTPAEGQPSTLFEAIAEGGGGGAQGVPMVEMIATTATIEPNKLYVWGEVSALTITLAEQTDTNIVNEYMMQFYSGETATTLTFTNGNIQTAGRISSSSVVNVSVLNNSALIG